MAKTDLPKPISLWHTLGPSFILLGLALGSGELLLWPYLAAYYGLGLLWGALLGISFQFVLNTEVMRYSLAKGESVFVGFRRISILITVWYIISTFIPWSIPGFSSAASNIISHAFPIVPEKIVAIGLLMLTGLLISSGKTLYKTMEYFQKTVVLVGLPFIITITLLLTGKADWVEAAWGLIGKGDGWWFFPPGIAITAFLGAFAYSGAGGNLNLAQSYYIKEKGFGMGKYMDQISSLFVSKKSGTKLSGLDFADSQLNRQRWRDWWRVVNLEHLIIFWGIGSLSIITLSVLARALTHAGLANEGLLFLFNESANISARLTPIAGIFFLLVAAMMVFSTQVGVLESSSRIISENILLLSFKENKKAKTSKAFYIALWGQILLGAVIYAIGFQEPKSLITLGAILNASAMMVSFLLVYLLNKRSLKKHYQPSVWRVAVMLAAFSFFAFFLFTILKDLAS